jgi:hypothetical protein
MEDGDKTQTANHDINALKEVFDDKEINHRSWPARSPDVNASDFYVYGNL